MTTWKWYEDIKDFSKSIDTILFILKDEEFRKVIEANKNECRADKERPISI